MTVQELIDALKAYPPDVKVQAEGYDQSCKAVVGVSIIDGQAYIRTSDDPDDQLYDVEY